MPKIPIARRLPLLDYIDSLGPKFDYDALNYEGVDRAQAIRVLDRVLPVLKRAFPPEADLSRLFSTVWHAHDDPFIAEIGFGMFDRVRERFWVSSPEADNARLYARTINRPLAWTPGGWVRVVNDERPPIN